MRTDCEGKCLRMIAPFIFGVGATLTLLVVYQAAANYNGEKFLEKLCFGNIIHIPQEQSPFQDLGPLLKKIAADDRTIIMTSVNSAWAQPDSLLDLFLQSFHNGEKIDHFLKHLLIIAIDKEAFERCKLVHPYCYQLTVDQENLSAAQEYLSKGYLDLVWAKVKLQQHILELGYNLLFTDVDILWFRNPFKHITMFSDITTSSDYYHGDPYDINNSPNTGFIYVKSNNKTIQMMRYWHDARKRYPADHEQGIFNQIKHEIIDSFGVNMQFVDTIYFGCFCSFSTDINKIYTMHANCCVTGLEAKLSDLRILMDNWKNYTALSIEEQNKFTWEKPGQCRL